MSSIYLLLFFVMYEGVRIAVFYIKLNDEKLKNEKLELYIEELNFELAKLRRK